ncbi:MAG: GAF domain-containing protein [Polyangiales bacterium]
MARTPAVRIHARGDAARLDAVLELVAFAAKPCPLSTSLDEIPRRIAAILRADVCSIYLLEGDDLVMRGNVGFPPTALGEVRLVIGEGITGTAVECMRPVSTAHATSHANYLHFPSLGEERFPIFLAVPVAGASGPLGALVLQRAKEPAFDEHEIELAAALTAPIAAAAERAHLREALRGERRATPGGGTRRVTLPSRPVSPGCAVGIVSAMRRPASRPAPEEKVSRKKAIETLDAAMTHANNTLATLIARARSLSLDGSQLELVRTIVADGRLRERVIELVEEGKGLALALQTVGGEAAREAAKSAMPMMEERAREISDVCEALAMLCAPDRRGAVARGAVLVGDRLTAFDLLVTAQSGVSAIALSEPVTTDSARTMLGLMGVPAVADVQGLFKWVADGDLVLVDGDHGFVRINPSRAEVAKVRVASKG